MPCPGPQTSGCPCERPHPPPPWPVGPRGLRQARPSPGSCLLDSSSPSRRWGRNWPLTASALHPQVQDAVKCRVVDRQEEGNGDSGGSFQNGHAQLMVGLGAGTQAAPARPPAGTCARPQLPVRRTSEPSLRLGSHGGESPSLGAWTGSRDEGDGRGWCLPRAHPLVPAMPFVQTPCSGYPAIRRTAAAICRASTPPVARPLTPSPALSLCTVTSPKDLTLVLLCYTHCPVSGTAHPCLLLLPTLQVSPPPGSLP